MRANEIEAGRYIGQRVPAQRGSAPLSGRGQFVDDISLPGMLHVAFARSPIARGNVLSINTAVARDVAGVHAILTQQDLARFKVEMINFFLLPPELPITPLADGRVCYVGEPVALVIADSRHIAEDAAALVEVEYAEEDPVVSIADARHGPLVHPQSESNIVQQMGEEEVGEELDALLNGAPHLVTQKVMHQRISQSPIETRGVVAVRDGTEELTLYITCQSPHMVARWTSLALGLPPTAIRVIAKDVGGGFGLKNHPWKEEVAVILAALSFGRPLKWIEDRYENLIAANQAREQEMVLRIAFDGDGKMLASHGDYSCNNGACPQVADCNIAVHMFLWAAYKMPRVRLSHARLVQQHGRACRLPRTVGDGVVDPRDRARQGRPADRYRPDRNPAPQFGAIDRPAHDLVHEYSSRGHHAGRMPREVWWRTSISPRFVRSRRRRAKKAGTWGWALRLMSNRPDPPAASRR